MANIPTIPSKASGDTFTLSNWNSIRDALNNGVVTQVACRVYRAANKTISNAAETGFDFDTEAYDTDGMHDAATNNTRITCVTAGKYEVGASVAWPTGMTTGSIMAAIRINGSTFTHILDIRPCVSSFAIGCPMTISGHISLAVGDYVELRVEQSSGSSVSAGGGQYGTSMWAKR